MRKLQFIVNTKGLTDPQFFDSKEEAVKWAEKQEFDCFFEEALMDDTEEARDKHRPIKAEQKKREADEADQLRLDEIKREEDERKEPKEEVKDGKG